MLRRLTSLLGLAALCLVQISPAFSARPESEHEKGKKVPQQYIVVLKDNADVETVSTKLSGKHHGSVLDTYKNAFKGFTVNLSDKEAEGLKSEPEVAFVSGDYEVSIDGRSSPAPSPAQVLPSGINRIDAELNTTNKGAGIGVAVIDTGIDLTHPDLAADVINGKNCIKTRSSANDDNGHGTHVAGTIGALGNSIGVVGVAPQSKLIAVKVLNSQGSGTWSSVICGIDWVTANASKYNIKVANMSLGGGGSSDGNCGNTNSDALHRAICNSVKNAGVTYLVAAGNSGVDASASVPAAYDDTVITVSALADSDGVSGGLGSATPYGADDTFASFSNYGPVVDLGAPGVNIYSTWKGGGYNTISGTSMATPHVSGAAALYINSHPGSSWTQVRDGLQAAAEILGAGHTDPSGLHPEPIVKAGSL